MVWKTNSYGDRYNDEKVIHGHVCNSPGNIDGSSCLERDDLREIVQELNPSKQVEGLILEDLIRFSDMRNHEPGTYYDFSADYGVPESQVFRYVTTESKQTTKKQFDKQVDDMISKNQVRKHVHDGTTYLHLNVDLDNPPTDQEKASYNRTIVNKLYS